MSAYTYTPLQSDDELDPLSVILSNCFGGTPEDLMGRVPVVGKDNIRLLKDASGVIGGLWQIPMGQYFTGRSIPMTGVAAVGIQPQSRGRGSAHTLMSECVREFYEREIALSALYPATNLLYRRSGYGLAGSWCVMNLDAKHLPLIERGLDVVPLTEDAHHEQIHRAYSAFARHREGYLDRGRYIWERIYNPRGMKADIYGTMEQGELTGYIFVGQRDANRTHELVAVDFAYTKARAGARMLTLLGQHKTMSDKAIFAGGMNHPIATFFPERAFSVELRSYWMIRLTHLAEALNRRAYPPGLRGTIHLNVADDVIPEQAGPWVLTLKDGAGSAEPGGRGSVSLDVRELATLYAGFHSARQLALDGRIEGPDKELDLLHQAFPSGAPAMAEMF